MLFPTTSKFSAGIVIQLFFYLCHACTLFWGEIAFYISLVSSNAHETKFFILLIDKHGLPVNQGAHILQITCDMGIIIIIIDKSVKITIIFLSACK